MEDKQIHCFYCGKMTDNISRDIKRKFGTEKSVNIKNVPLFSCVSCKEVFYPKSVMKVLNGLDRIDMIRKGTVEYEDIKQ